VVKLILISVYLTGIPSHGPGPGRDQCDHNRLRKQILEKFTKRERGRHRRKTHPFREIPDCEQEQARSEGGSVKNVEVKASLPSADFGHKRAQTHYSNTLTIQCTDLDLSTNLNVDPKIDETRHVTHMSGTCHIYEWGMSRILMGHIAYMNETCYT